MTTPVRFAYADTAASHTDGSRLAYLPITLSHGTHVLAVAGLLDTGSTVNVLPYPLGLQLGFVWGTTADTSALDWESCQAAGARCDRLSSSGIVSTR